MSNDEKILAMLESINNRLDSMDSRMDRMDSRLNRMENDIADLKEGQEEIRGSVNRLVEWADECTYAIKLPLPKL